MSQTETVKVELKLPEPIYRAVKVICETFLDDPHDYMVRAIRGGIDSDITNNFEAWSCLFTKRIEAILESGNLEP